MTTTDAPVTVELQPCPFCGGEAERLTIGDDEPNNAGGDVIVCTSCQASSHVEFGFKENLVSHWNSRHRLAALASAPVGDGLPDGWQAVPRTPTGAMTRAGGLAFNDDPDVLSVTAHEASQAWTAMLAAAPAARARPRAAVGEWANTRRLALENASALERIADDADENGWQDWSATMRQAVKRFRLALQSPPAKVE